MSAPEVRRNLSGDIDNLVDSALGFNDEVEELEMEKAKIEEELEVLSLLTPQS